MDIMHNLIENVDRPSVGRGDIVAALQDAEASLAKSDAAYQKSLTTEHDAVAHMYLTESLRHEQRAANLIALATLRQQS